ncbi:EF-hand and coiled-coil domain-containing protein 1 [Otolemur garnettii]|uniref:EF-hand and coiled-coil domain-containing protein 1 n=1 Tax=Otolemur garnettii TaxID=30611 RepID=UPI0006447360|nr:EF-hand and coiled-coil domain-containing protein 1 [Otolemur garnettii]
MEPGSQDAEAGSEGAAGDPYRRPARRTQWLLSALAHHYGLDRGVENEIVVLATGLDQYLQEVFHHLDCRGAGRLPRADFRALCAVLGLRAEGTTAAREAAAEDVNSKNVSTGDAAPVTDADSDAEEEARLALHAEPPELTFRQFHARLCGYFGTRAGPRLPRGALSEHIETQIRLRRPRRRRRLPRVPGPDGGPDGGSDDERVARLEEENSSLRELVEDLRAALQSSDARCLALQLRSLHRVRELEAQARQVPSLQRWVRRLEAELRRYRSGGSQLPTLTRASPEPGDKSGKPEDIGTRDPDPTAEGAWQSDSSCGSRALDEVDEQLFRSVEGQAASDEEEEEEWQEEQRPPAEAKPLLAQLSGCRSGCDDQTAKRLLTCFGHFGGADHTHALGELEARVAMLVKQLGTQGCSGGKTLGTLGEEAELQQKVEENEHLRLELQMVETERVRLSLLEEKLVDVLQLLQRLRALNISKRALGKILLSTLDTCRDQGRRGSSGPLAILNALHGALAGCELLQGQPSELTSEAPALTSPLLISC